MNNAPAIAAQRIGKEYQLGLRAKSRRTLREVITDFAVNPVRRFRHLAGNASRSEKFWALKDVSFDVQPGEVIGVIGRNGAGKSTLLKIVSGITEPTTGRAIVRGRVGSLLEVGTGFHNELTGRENVYLNGSILGMRHREIRRKFDEIIAFSGTEQFLDTPVKHYSSGMKIRLGFAVAAHLEPEILIVDEVLAVGDADFQKKCLGKMNDVATSGRTVLFVSHNMAAVEALCTTGMLLDAGEVIFRGSAEDTISLYVTRSSDLRQGEVDLTDHPNRTLHKRPVFQKIRIIDDQGRTTTAVELGKPLTIELYLASKQRLIGVVVGIHFYDSLGRRVVTCHSGYQSPSSLELNGETVLRCRMESCRLMPGVYSVVLGLAAGHEGLDRIEPATEIEVLSRDIYNTGKIPPPRDGVYAPDVEWSFSI